MPHEKTAPAVRLTIEELQDFITKIRDDVMAEIKYDPAETPLDPMYVTDEDIVAEQLERVDYEYAEAHFDAIEDVLMRGVALTSQKELCSYCNEPFTKFEKRPVLFCPACGQLVKRKDMTNNEKVKPTKLVPNAISRGY